MKSIILQHISQDFYQAGKKITLFKDVNYTFEQAKTYAITGVSGTGKSTLLHIISGLEKPTAGAVLFNEKNINLLSTDSWRAHMQQDIGLMLQYPYLINELTVLENVALKGRIAGLSEHDAQAQAQELLHQVGLAAFAASYPAQLSGGEQQRVALARALMGNPPFIIADEPTAHLDEHHKKAVAELLLACARKHGCGVIISSHDPAIIALMQTKLTIHDGALCPA